MIIKKNQTTKSVTIKTKSGKEVEFTFTMVMTVSGPETFRDEYGYEHTYRGSTARVGFSADIIATVDGRTFKASKGNAKFDTVADKPKALKCLDAARKAGAEYFTIIDKLVMGVSAEEAKKVSDLIDDMEAELLAMDKEAQEIDKARKEMSRKEDINRANEIMKRVAGTIRMVGHLPTRKEADKWLREYNDDFNEGGEGWVPNITDAESVEWAKQVLSA